MRHDGHDKREKGPLEDKDFTTTIASDFCAILCLLFDYAFDYIRCETLATFVGVRKRGAHGFI